MRLKIANGGVDREDDDDEDDEDGADLEPKEPMFAELLLPPADGIVALGARTVVVFIPVTVVAAVTVVVVGVVVFVVTAVVVVVVVVFMPRVIFANGDNRLPELPLPVATLALTLACLGFVTISSFNLISSQETDRCCEPSKSATLHSDSQPAAGERILRIAIGGSSMHGGKLRVACNASLSMLVVVVLG